MIALDRIQEALKLCEESGEAIVLGCAAMKMSTDKKKKDKGEKAIVVLTEISITVFQEKPKKTDRKSCRYWKNLTGFDMKDDDKLVLSFTDVNYQFSFENRTIVVSRLVDCLYRILTEDELTLLRLDRYKHTPLIPNARGLLSRLSMCLKTTREPVGAFYKQSDLYQRLYSAICSEDECFVFAKEDPFADYLKVILDTIRAAPYLKALEFGRSDNPDDMFEAFGEMSQANSNLKFVLFGNEPTVQFQTFQDDIKKSQVTKVDAIGFRDTKLKQANLVSLQKFVTAKGLKSLYFRNAWAKDLDIFFAQKFITEPMMNTLQYLAVDQCKSVRFEDLIPCVKNITVLSVADCDLDIATILRLITDNKLQKLRMLCLAGNVGHDSCSNVKFPPYLERLDLERVEWEAGVFPDFWKNLLAFKWKRGLALYARDMQMSEADWSATDILLQNESSAPLVELSWSGNKLFPSTMEWIGKNEKLKYLFLDECVNGKNALLLEKLLEVLPKLDKVTHISIAGKRKKKSDKEDLFLGLKTDKVLNAICEMGSVKYVDISKNRGKEKIVPALVKLITKKKNLEYLNFDENLLDNIDNYLDVIDAAEKSKRCVKIGFPFVDMKKVKKREGDEDKDYGVEIGKMLYLVSIGMPTVTPESPLIYMHDKKGKSKGKDKDKKSKGKGKGKEEPSEEQSNQVDDPFAIPPDQGSLFLDGFETFKNTMTDEFPRYITEEMNRYFEKHPLKFKKGGKKDGDKSEEQNEFRAIIPTSGASADETDDTDNDTAPLEVIPAPVSPLSGALPIVPIEDQTIQFTGLAPLPEAPTQPDSPSTPLSGLIAPLGALGPIAPLAPVPTAPTTGAAPVKSLFPMNLMQKPQTAQEEKKDEESSSSSSGTKPIMDIDLTLVTPIANEPENEPQQIEGLPDIKLDMGGLMPLGDDALLGKDEDDTEEQLFIPAELPADQEDQVKDLPQPELKLDFGGLSMPPLGGDDTQAAKGDDVPQPELKLDFGGLSMPPLGGDDTPAAGDDDVPQPELKLDFGGLSMPPLGGDDTPAAEDQNLPQPELKLDFGMPALPAEEPAQEEIPSPIMILSMPQMGDEESASSSSSTKKESEEPFTIQIPQLGEEEKQTEEPAFNIEIPQMDEQPAQISMEIPIIENESSEDLPTIAYAPIVPDQDVSSSSSDDEPEPEPEALDLAPIDPVIIPEDKAESAAAPVAARKAPSSSSSSDEEDDAVESTHKNAPALKPTWAFISNEPGPVYRPPSWVFPVPRTGRVWDDEYVDEMEKTYSLEALVAGLKPLRQ